MWQSHQFSAFQGGALERGSGNVIARPLSRQLMPAYVRRIEILTQSHRGRGVLSEFTSSVFSAALCEHFPCSLTLGVWQSHQFSAFQGGALERGAGDLQSVAADVVFADEADQIVGEVGTNVLIPRTNDQLSGLPR